MAAIVLLVVFFAFVRHWAAVHSGTTNESGVYYAFWSGFGADLGEATLITAVIAGVYTGARKVNCHTKGCWRIGHHALDGTPYILCRHHHPDVPSGGASHARDPGALRAQEARSRPPPPPRRRPSSPAAPRRRPGRSPAAPSAT